MRLHAERKNAIIDSVAERISYVQETAAEKKQEYEYDDSEEEWEDDEFEL